MRPAPDRSAQHLLRTGLLVICVALVTTAGACRGEEPEGPPPSPSELTGIELPADSVTTGIDATLATSLRVSEFGRPCYFLVAAAADGSANDWRGCADPPSATAAGKPEQGPDAIQVGDYALTGDELMVRTVEWNWLAEAYELKEYRFVPCPPEPRPPAVRDSGPVDYDVNEPWQLVAGTLGTEVASGDNIDSCWSVARNVRWVGD